MAEISTSLEKNLQVFEELLFRKVNTDMIRRDFRVFRAQAAVYFVDGLVSTDYLQHYVLTPCQQHADAALTLSLEDALLQTIHVGDVAAVESYAEAVDAIVNGKAVLLITLKS